MANLLIIVDPDAGRRSAFAGTVAPALTLVDGLILGRCAAGDFAAVRFPRAALYRSDSRNALPA